MSETMNFAPRPSAEWAANFESIIDAAMQAENAAQAPRKYLGASRVGDECLRKLGYEYHHAPKDPDREFKGSTLRIFKRGHDGEANMANWLRLAGFKLVTEKASGEQLGFATGWSEERGAHTFAGHLDGVIVEAPYASGVVCPALWEHKVLGEKGWKDVVAKGVRASKPVYFAQMQLYMSYLDLADNPALFTTVNANTGQIYAERVAFDAAAAQSASDKGVKVITSQSAEELPRVAQSMTDYRCKLCDYPSRCWATAIANVFPTSEPSSWSFGAKNGG